MLFEETLDILENNFLIREKHNSNTKYSTYVMYFFFQFFSCVLKNLSCDSILYVILCPVS